ncbi:hypothetical protein [Comamonas thiooxydans]|uniref:hypothetical protein n=1 Tax=Comamonas thiooxydans TaxID=363952 RepID=UPI0011862614|nr:hypothetical protein [Comamonas thiooxydans]
MLVTNYGSLHDSRVQEALAKAQKSPEKWMVYLVHANGQQYTSAQMGLYRRLLRKFAQQQGRDVEYWNAYFVKRFLGYEEVPTEEGYVRRVPVSVSSLDCDEFASYLNACLVVAAESQVR